MAFLKTFIFSDLTFNSTPDGEELKFFIDALTFLFNFYEEHWYLFSTVRGLLLLDTLANYDGRRSAEK
jgi:hypothetical protein